MCLLAEYLPGRRRSQYQAAIVIFGAWRGSSRSELYEELGWESLSNRRKCRRVLQIHKIVNSTTPSNLKDKLPPNCRALFNGNIHREIICKSNRYMNSFFPDAISSWHIFIIHFNDISSFDILKAHINTLFRPKFKSNFGIHDPAGVIPSLIPLQSFVNAIKALKRQVIFYFLVLFM